MYELSLIYLQQIGVSRYSLSSTARDLCEELDSLYILHLIKPIADQKEIASSGRLTNLRDLLTGDEHLKGEHTIRMSPIR